MHLISSINFFLQHNLTTDPAQCYSQILSQHGRSYRLNMKTDSSHKVSSPWSYMYWLNMFNSGLAKLFLFAESQRSTGFLDNDAAFTASVNLNFSTSVQQLWSFLIVCIFKNTPKSQCSFPHFRQPKGDQICALRSFWCIWSSVPAYYVFLEVTSMFNPVWPWCNKISHLAEHQRTEIESVSHGIKYIYFICSCKSSQIYVHIVLWKVYNKYCLTVCSKNYMKYLFQMLYF